MKETRLERNERIRQANKKKLAANELRPKRYMVTVAMNPTGRKSK